jgi:hypothetical protein
MVVAALLVPFELATDNVNVADTRALCESACSAVAGIVIVSDLGAPALTDERTGPADAEAVRCLWCGCVGPTGQRSRPVSLTLAA